jgi:hypothetical protein
MLPRAGYWRLVDLLTGVMAVVSVCSVIDVIVRPAQILGLPLFSSGGRGFGLGATRLFYNPNAIGSFVQFFPALILARLALDEADGWPRPSRSPWRAAALAVISIHLALTFSRSSQLVALLSLTPLVVRVRPAVRRRLLIVAGPAAVVLGAASVLNPVLRRHAAEWLSFEGRWALWSAFGPSIRQAPILGTGLFGTYANGQTPHNVFLAQLVFFGSVGLAVFLAMMVVFARAVRAGLGRAPCVSRQLVACLLVAALGQGVVEYIVSFPLLFSNSMFWLCLGLAAAPRHPRPLGPSDPRALSALP